MRDAAAQLDRELLLETQPVELVTAGMSMRDGSYDADDAIPEFVGLSADESPVHLQPGAVGRLAAAAGMELTCGQVSVYRWSDFTFANGEVASARGAGTAGSGAPDGSGAVSVTAPARAGDYVLGFTLEWRTACLQGDGVAYARIVVR